MKTKRNNTRVLVVCHSHEQKTTDKPYNLSNYVINLTTSKTVKGAGTFSFSLVGAKNWLNYLFPDDVINIYIDPGDGKRGFIRTMMGYINRVERTESANSETGEVVTMFTITGDDFSKALEKTEIYHNPHIANRKDFILDDFGNRNIGGANLRTKGITCYGTPASMCENLLTLLLGFGAQWIMPASYQNQAAWFVQPLRDARYLKQSGKITLYFKEMLNLYTPGITVDKAIMSGVSSEDLGNLIKNGPVMQGLVKDLEPLNKLINENAKKKKKTSKATEASVKALLKRINTVTQIANDIEGNLEYKALLTAYGQLSAYRTTILDYMSLDFIETAAIDGFNSASAVWGASGSLMGLIRSFSNEFVNELCLDLRPVAEGPGIDESTVFGTEIGRASPLGVKYSYMSDELGYNVNGIPEDGFPAGPPAVQYIPAVVMREYPYSVVEGIDLSGYPVFGKEANLGDILFGPIFAQGLNKPGRKVYDYSKAIKVNSEGKEVNVGTNAISTIHKSFPPGTKALKHLDVVTINTSDVKSSNMGRSDKDVFNFFAMYNSDILQANWKYMLAGFLPVVTPISIARHGLRVRENNSKFANYSREQLGIHTNRGTKANNVANAPGLDNVPSRGNLTRWALLIDSWFQHNAEYLTGTISLPIMPEIRVGYRLDWVDRNESYYVESVTNQWNYPGQASTSVQVARGQPNNPLPLYVLPQFGKIVHNLPVDLKTTIEDINNNTQIIAAMSNNAVELVKRHPYKYSTKRIWSHTLKMPTALDTGKPTLGTPDQIESKRLNESLSRDGQIDDGVRTGGNRGVNGRLSLAFKVKNTEAQGRAITFAGSGSRLGREEDGSDFNSVDSTDGRNPLLATYHEIEVPNDKMKLRNEESVVLSVDEALAEAHKDADSIPTSSNLGNYADSGYTPLGVIDSVTGFKK